MDQPQVKAVFSQRKSMVEPVFSNLRGRQGLNRFRRMGLKAVMREFALHAVAHNISRALALLRAFISLLKRPWRALSPVEVDLTAWIRKIAPQYA